MCFTLIILFILFAVVAIIKYSEIKLTKIENMNNEIIKSMQKRSFFPECVPSNIHNIQMAWDIDTNELYMKFYFNKKLTFYKQENCIKQLAISKENKPKNKLIDIFAYPYFVQELKSIIESSNNLTIYKSYFNNSSKSKFLYIIIDKNNNVGYAFSLQTSLAPR